MKVYTIHIRHRPQQDHEMAHDIVLVREGFCWMAFLFTVLWAVYHRLWAVAAVIAGVFVVLNTGAGVMGLAEDVLAVLNLGVSVLVGFLAHDLRRHALCRDGFADPDVVVARNAEAAEQRYFDRNPDLIAEPSP